VTASPRQPKLNNACLQVAAVDVTVMVVQTFKVRYVETKDSQYTGAPPIHTFICQCSDTSAAKTKSPPFPPHCLTVSLNCLLARNLDITFAPSMSTAASQDHDNHASDAVIEISDTSAEGILLDRLRKNLITVKIRDADNYNDQTRNLLDQYLNLLPLSEQNVIIGQLDALVQSFGVCCSECVALTCDDTGRTNWRRIWKIILPYFENFCWLGSSNASLKRRI
jgi:hypothetical protein